MKLIQQEVFQEICPKHKTKFEGDICRPVGKRFYFTYNLQVEALVHSHLLTHLSDDINDFLIGRACNRVSSTTRNAMFWKRWRHVEAITFSVLKMMAVRISINKWRTDVQD